MTINGPSDPITCSVCQTSILEGQRRWEHVTFAPEHQESIVHRFHFACLVESTRQYGGNLTCPICRWHISDNDNIAYRAAARPYLVSILIAAHVGNLSRLRELLANHNHSITEKNRGLIVTEAAAHGSWSVIPMVLHQGPIPEEARRKALLCALFAERRDIANLLTRAV